jgi:urease accessory protein
MIANRRLHTVIRAAQATLAGGALLASGAAMAHTGHDTTSGFMSGLAHPVGGLDHLLAMVAVGLWAARCAPAGRRALAPVAFVTCMALAAAFAYAGWLALPALELGIAVSVLLLGVLLLGGRKVPEGVALALVAGSAVLHGAAHGLELQPDASGWLYGAGFVLATAVLHGLGYAASWSMARLSRRHSTTWHAVLGAGIGLGGVVMMLSRI